MLAVLFVGVLMMFRQARLRVAQFRHSIYLQVDMFRVSPRENTPVPEYSGRVPLDCQDSHWQQGSHLRVDRVCQGPLRELRGSRSSWNKNQVEPLS